MLVIPTLHPAAILRAADDHASFARFEQVVMEDMAKALRLLKSTPTWDESVIWEKKGDRHWRLFPTADEVVDFCERAARTVHARYISGDPYGYLSLDVECNKSHSPLDTTLICVGLGFRHADGRRDVICVPNLSQGGIPYWTDAHDRARVGAAVAELLFALTVPKVMHNGAFDSCVMQAFGMPIRNWAADTMQAHHVLDAELPQGLGFVASRLLDIKYWKDDVKGKGAWLSLDNTTLRSYNLRDVLCTSDLCGLLHQRLQKTQRFVELYLEELELCRIMLRGTLRGIEADIERRDSTQLDAKGHIIGIRPRLAVKRVDALSRLGALNGTSFNPQSPGQLQDFLFRKLAFPIVKETPTGLPSTDKDAMVLLALQASNAAQVEGLKALVDFRQSAKMLQMVDSFPILADGRLHVQWKLLPVSGRFSSSPNAQNWGKQIKRLFRAGYGRKLVGIDLSQAELRMMAYAADDQQLLEMYATGVNVHTVNAALLFRELPALSAAAGHKDLNAATEQYLRKLLGADYAKLTISTTWKETRTLAKNFVFGGNYGAEAETLLNVLRAKRDPETGHQLFPHLELDVVEALRVRWLRLHPEIPKWWRMIEKTVPRAGGYSCPISGRTRFYRGGFKRNEMLNFPIQTGVASWVNKCMIDIQHTFDDETGGAAQIIQQVHDAITCEGPDEYAPRAGQVMQDRINRQFDLPRYPTATLPADKADIGVFLDET